ncbi:MAG: hypothetical protein HC876_10595 [Chloroflexaceae bacterium]|nr:hypothetical protein [Chloroflexaceae bacterium]
MAQDFAAAFGLGADDISITTVDADGVALAAIQGLHTLVQEQDAQINALQHDNATLQQDNATLLTRLEALEQRVATQDTPSSAAYRWRPWSVACLAQSCWCLCGAPAERKR